MKQNIKKFWVSIRGKKWGGAFSPGYLMHQSILSEYCQSHVELISLKSNLGIIALFLLNKHGVLPKGLGRKSSSEDEQRFNRLHHFVQNVERKKEEGAYVWMFQCCQKLMLKMSSWSVCQMFYIFWYQMIEMLHSVWEIIFLCQVYKCKRMQISIFGVWY